MNNRSYLRLALARLSQCEDFLQKIPDYGVDVAKAIVKVREARDAALEAIEPFLVKCGDKEPLNDQEEIAFDKLNTFLKLGDTVFAELTHEQKFAATRVLARRSFKGLKEAWGAGDYLALQFEDIMIGIEKDGYAHS